MVGVEHPILEVVASVGIGVDKVIGNVGIVGEVVNRVHGSEDVAEVGVGGHGLVLSSWCAFPWLI